MNKAITTIQRIRSSMNKDVKNSLNLDFYIKYHNNFKETGEHKAKSVVNQIQSLRKIPNLKKMAYVSLGGSTGSEIMWILKNTEVFFGVLMEVDSYACQIAREESKQLPPGKEIHIITGDISQQIENLQDLLREPKEKKIIDGIIISANAIFHELPYRSKDYKLNTFLNELFWDWDNCIFVCREPCKPFNWPERVELSIPGISSDLLYNFCQDINYKLNFSDKIQRCGPNFVEMSSELATEMIQKLFYIEDYNYEIQEKLTNINPDEFISVVESILGKNSVFQVRLNSASFSKKYQELNVTARTIKGEPLTMPLSFFNVVASRQK
jgi:DNA-directed RNA polymerase subunit F